MRTNLKYESMIFNFFDSNNCWENSDGPKCPIGQAKNRDGVCKDIMSFPPKIRLKILSKIRKSPEFRSQMQKQRLAAAQRAADRAKQAQMHQAPNPAPGFNWAVSQGGVHGSR